MGQFPSTTLDQVVDIVKVSGRLTRLTADDGRQVKAFFTPSLPGVDWEIAGPTTIRGFRQHDGSDVILPH